MPSGIAVQICNCLYIIIVGNLKQACLFCIWQLPSVSQLAVTAFLGFLCGHYRHGFYQNMFALTWKTSVFYSYCLSNICFIRPCINALCVQIPDNLNHLLTAILCFFSFRNVPVFHSYSEICKVNMLNESYWAVIFVMNFGLIWQIILSFFECLLGGLQIAEVVNIMKDLIDYSQQTGKGPIGKLYKKIPSFGFIVFFCNHCLFLFLVLAKDHQQEGGKDAYLVSLKMSNFCIWQYELGVYLSIYKVYDFK